MKVYFGDKLKQLRTERQLTQDALAESLGVSFQTISKWERGETYPDITVLPAIAALFETTVDDLLSTDKPQKELKANALIDLYEKMQLKNAPDVLKKYRIAIKEHPENYDLLVRYMELLRLESSRNLSEYESIAHELTSAYFKILGRCKDEAIIIRAKRILVEHLMFQYCCLGYDEEYRKQAKLISDSLPALSDSKEIVSLQIADVAEWKTIYSDTIEELSYQLQKTIIGYCYYSNSFSPEYKADIIEHINGILKLLDNSKRLTKNRIHIIYNYGHLGHLYAEIGNTEKALENLRLAAELAAKTDDNPDAQRVMLFYEQEARFRNMNMCERMRELMTEHYNFSDEFKEMPEFHKILNLLK